MLKHLLLASLVCVCACAETASETASEDRAAAEPSTVQELVVETEDGRVFNGGPVAIRVGMVADPPVQISVSAQDGEGGTWSALLGASIEELASGELKVALARRPLAPGVGIVSERREAAPKAVESGDVELRLGAGRALTGSAFTAPSRSSAAIRGRYAFSCWVVPQELGEASNGEGGGAQEMIEDTELVTPFCQQFAHLR